MSSSGSWSGAGGRPADIIDLDKFMRGGVRPSRHVPSVQDLCDRLVVDNGGPSMKVNVSSSRESTSIGRRRAKVAPARVKHQKHFSHDSGLSDGSYSRRRHRPHRRVLGQETGTPHRGVRDHRSTDSLRAFRAVCERALLDQQKQIARVAQLCERLTVHRVDRAERADKPERREPSVSSSADSGDLSSSSKSTEDQRRKDKHRTQECKTYKIIMNKLDELNRLFTAGGRSPLPGPRPRPSTRTPSSGSVTVTDKVVATEPDLRKPYRAMEQQGRKLVERAVGNGSGSVRGSVLSSHGRSNKIGTTHAVTRAYALDISPREASASQQHRERPNVITESVIKHEYSEGGSYSSRRGYDLNDPVHFYSQAKHLQATQANVCRRAHSADGVPLLTKHERELNRERFSKETNRTLCSLCRCYWRSIRHFLFGQLFCCPDEFQYS